MIHILSWVLELSKNYQDVFLNDSSNKSLWLFGKFLNLLGRSNNCSKSDILEFIFDIFVLNENNMFSVEDDSVAFLLIQLKFEFPSVDSDVLVWNKKFGTFGIREVCSERLQKEFFNFERFFVSIGDFKIVFIFKFEHQWAAGAW